VSAQETTGPQATALLPAWECQTSADGRIRASLRSADPPVVLSGADWADLRAQIRSWVLVHLL